jgi:hypothetical protein
LQDPEWTFTITCPWRVVSRSVIRYGSDDNDGAARIAELWSQSSRALTRSRRWRGTRVRAWPADGLYEVVSLMQQQADAFGSTYEELSLAGLNPEQDLL